MLVLFLITAALIFHSSMYCFIKYGLIVFIVIKFKGVLSDKSPCSNVQTIHLSKSTWILSLKDGRIQSFEQAQILIHNVLFQQIKLSSPNINKIMIIFNDQVAVRQLRLLHLTQIKPE